MKIKEGFIVKEVAGSNVVVPVGENLVDFQLMLTLNDTGLFLWNALNDDTTEEELCDKLCADYTVDKETVRQDVAEFIALLDEKKVLEK